MHSSGDAVNVLLIQPDTSSPGDDALLVQLDVVQNWRAYLTERVMPERQPSLHL